MMQPRCKAAGACAGGSAWTYLRGSRRKCWWTWRWLGRGHQALACAPERPFSETGIAIKGHGLGLDVWHLRQLTDRGD